MSYAWIDAGNGRSIYRKIDTQERAQSDLPRPMLIKDCIEPCVSMADGRVYSSKSALRATYKPSGNPAGASFSEVGNEKLPTHRPKAKAEGIKDSINAARAKLGIL